MQRHSGAPRTDDDGKGGLSPARPCDATMGGEAVRSRPGALSWQCKLRTPLWRDHVRTRTSPTHGGSDPGSGFQTSACKHSPKHAKGGLCPQWFVTALTVHENSNNSKRGLGTNVHQRVTGHRNDSHLSRGSWCHSSEGQESLLRRVSVKNHCGTGSSEHGLIPIYA